MTSDNWLTPPAGILNPLGGFEANDLDPAAAVDQPWPTALHHYTIRDNGLMLPWEGQVFLNPPYSNIRPWLARLAAHGRGLALVFAKTDTAAFAQYVWPRANALLFIAGRLSFFRPDGTQDLRKDGRPVEARLPSVLCAYGEQAADRLAGSGIPGAFVPLIVQHYVLAAHLPGTWESLVLAFFSTRQGPVRNAELYLAFAAHPRAKTNRHWKAKIRQVLQEAKTIRPIDRGLWELA